MKKKKLFILQTYFKEFYIEQYLYKIVSFDLILKLQFLNFYQLAQLLKNQQIQIKINITEKINMLKEVNDSLLLLKNLTKQKSLLFFEPKTNSYYLQLNINSKNKYYSFLYILINYLFPFFYKKQKIKIKRNHFIDLNFYNFNIIFDNQFDFFEQIIVFLSFRFNIYLDYNKTKYKDILQYLYLTSLQIM